MPLPPPPPATRPTAAPSHPTAPTTPGASRRRFEDAPYYRHPAFWIAVLTTIVCGWIAS